MAREVPQYISQLNVGSMPKVQHSMAGAEATQRVSAQLGAIGEDMQRKANDIEELQVKTTFSENLNRIYHESPNDPGAVKTKLDGFLKTFIPGIKNGDLQKRMSITAGVESQPFIDKATENFGKIQDGHLKVTQLKALSQNKINMGNAVNVLLSAKSPEEMQDAQKAIQNYVDENIRIASSTDSKGFAQFDPERQAKEAQDVARTVLDAIPAEQRMEVLGGSKGGWEAQVPLIQKHEGGLNIDDGNTGNPAIFGINKKHHEAAFNEVKAIYDTGDTKAAQAAADAYLKKTFWDANGLDSLKPEQQGIVYDGLINGAPKKLLARAKEGAPPSELIAIRQEYYDKLAASGKYAKKDIISWNNRLADYRHLAVGEYKDMLPPDEIVKYRKEAVAQFKAQEEEANINRVMGAATQNREIFAKFTANEPGVLQTIEDYKNNGGDPELANYMRTSALTRNKLSAGEQDQVYTSVVDRVKDTLDKLNEDADEVPLEDLVRLQSDIMKESVRGVTGLDSQLKKLSAPILDKARIEKGRDDIGFWSDANEPLDNGYEVIQKFLEKQGKENDLALKASMIKDFVAKTDKLPDDIKGDQALYDQAQDEIARMIVSKTLSKGMPNIPLGAINLLISDPSKASQFDEKFGAGASARILGKR